MGIGPRPSLPAGHHRPPTLHPDADDLLDRLRAEIGSVLGGRLVGLYLYGSLVSGGFDPGVSDVDLLAATAGDVADRDLARLLTLHADVARDFPAWDDRIEVAYLSVDGLRTFKERSGPIVVVSPGEPLNRKEAGRDWLANWYQVRTEGRTLVGPPPSELIAPVSREEFVAAVRDYARTWAERIEEVPKRTWHAYAILTMCRALYSDRFGEPVSKPDAAAWARGAFPEWAPVIGDALAWRAAWREGDGDPDRTLPAARRFVRFALDQIREAR